MSLAMMTRTQPAQLTSLPSVKLAFVVIALACMQATVASSLANDTELVHRPSQLSSASAPGSPVAFEQAAIACNQPETVPCIKPPTRRLSIGITVSIPKEQPTIFTNGARQAAFFCYDMLRQRHDAFLINLDGGEPEDVEDPTWNLANLEVLRRKEAVERRPDVVLMFGMQLSQWQLQSLRDVGAKIVNYRVGSDYIISTERMLFNGTSLTLYWTTNFDEAWFLPSFERQRHIFHLAYRSPPERTLGVPFIWAPRFFDYMAGTLKKRPYYEPRPGPRSVTVMEPNMNVVKTAFVPMVAAELVYRRRPELIDNVYVTNAKKLAEKSAAFRDFVTSRMTVYGDDHMSFEDRYKSYKFFSDYTDVLLSHQWKNELNYLHIEALYAGYPLVHNSPFFRDCGYYYHANDVTEASRQLEFALEHHDENADEYLERARQCVFRHSMHNADNVHAWDSLLINLVNGSLSDEQRSTFWDLSRKDQSRS